MIIVSDDDVRAAWNAFFARPEGLQHVELLAPEDVADSSLTMDGLRRVIEQDRQRVTEASAT